MTQTLHILRKDLRRGWPLLLLWAALLAYWIAPIWADPLDAESLERLGSGRAVLVLLAGILGAGLTIQQDPLVGVRELWMTRPIRPSSLLAAKALFLGVFVVLPPIALQLAVLARYGLPLDRWPVQLVELALPWAAAIAVASLVAAWTRGLPGFLGGLAVLFLGFSLSLVPSARGHISDLAVSFPSSPLPALGAVSLLLLLLMYATRRRTLGVVVGVPLLVLAGSGALSWRLTEFLERAPRQFLPEVRVELTPGPGRTAFAAERPGATAGRIMDLWFVASPAGQTHGRVLTLSRIDGEIEWDDGRSTPFYVAGEWYLADSPSRTVGLDWADGRGPRQAWRALGIQGDRTFESLLGRSGTLRGRADGTAWELAEIETLPLRPGAEHEQQGSKLRILEVDRAPGDFQIRLRSRDLFDLRLGYPRLQIALANRDRGETIPLQLRGGGGRMTWPGLLAPRPALVWAREAVMGVRDPFAFDSADAGAALDSEWLDGAELLLTYYRYAGAVEVAVEAADLTVDTAEGTSPALYAGWRAPWF